MKNLSLIFNLSFLTMTLVSCGGESALEGPLENKNTQIDKEALNFDSQKEPLETETQESEATQDAADSSTIKTSGVDKNFDEVSTASSMSQLMSQAQELGINLKGGISNRPVTSISSVAGLGTAATSKYFGASLLGAGGFATVGASLLTALVTYYVTDTEGFNRLLETVVESGNDIKNHASDNPAEYTSGVSAVALAGITKLLGASAGLSGFAGAIPLVAGLSYLYVYEEERFDMLVSSIKKYGNIAKESIVSNPKLTSPVSGLVTATITKYMGASLMSSAILGAGVAVTAGLGILYVYDEEEFNSLKETAREYFETYKAKGAQLASEYPIPSASSASGLGLAAVTKLLGASATTTLGTAGFGAVVGASLATLYVYDKDNFDKLVETSQNFKENAVETIVNNPGTSAASGLALAITTLFMYIKYKK
jgi:hypothetical protein